MINSHPANPVGAGPRARPAATHRSVTETRHRVARAGTGTRPYRTLLLLLSLAASAGAVTISEAGGTYTIDAPNYHQTIGPKGWIGQLQTDGQEFLRAGGQGGYCYQRGVLPMTSVTHPTDDVIRAECVSGSMTLTFDDVGETWSFENTSKELLQYILVLAPEVSAVREGEGKYFKAPAERAFTDSTFFRGTGKVRLEGSTKIWGPFAKVHQVWELRVAPGETKEVRVTLGRASEDEMAKAEEAANRVIEPPKDPVGPMWDLARLGQTPQMWPAEGYDEPGVKAIFYAGEPYEEHPTKVFAWLGMPEVPAGQTVPGMVLVHGGGGTAFPEWVRMWNERGYAAIAMDTCGCLPGGEHSSRPRNPDGGPPGWGGWNQIDWPRTDQWTYHAVADVVLADSLLRAQPGVDPERIGLTGISWGGYLTSLVAGVDPRFKFAAPVYGCGFYEGTHFAASLNNFTDEQRDRWLRWWDPNNYLPNAKMPMLWVTGSNDFAFWFPGLQQSYRTAPGPDTLAIRLRMPHGQGQGAAPQEIPVFADQVLRNGPGLPEITGQGRDGNKVWCTFTGQAKIVKAELNLTKDTDPNWPERKWDNLPATLTAGRVEAELPEGVAVYYLNLFDEADCVVSTEHEVLRNE